MSSLSTPMTGGQAAGVGKGSAKSGELTVYWGSGSPPCWRVLAALQEKGLKYRSELITFDSGVLKTAPFRALNPRGLVPIMVDGDVVITESLAILEWLEQMYPESPLLPSDRRARALALTRTHEAQNVSVAAGELIYYVRRTPPEKINREYLETKQFALAAELEVWERYLSASDYLAGPGQGLSQADLSFFPSLAYMVRLGLRLDGVFPNLMKYFVRMTQRKSIMNTWPPHWMGTTGMSCLSGVRRAMGSKPTTDHSLHLVTKSGGVPRPGPMNDTKAGSARPSGSGGGALPYSRRVPVGKVSSAMGGAAAMDDGEDEGSL